MRPLILPFIALLILFLGSCQSKAQKKDDSNKMQLWYTSPANEWLEALPIGNGRLGAMIFGGIKEDQIQLNEESLWAGMPEDPYPENVGKHYATFQQLNLEGNYEEALNYGMEHLAVSPTSIRSYEPLGELHISFDHQKSPENYRRTLDMETGVITSTYTINGKRYLREAFSSAKYNVIFYHFESLDGEPVSSTIRFDREKDIVQSIGEGKTLYVDGQVFDDPDGYDDNVDGSGKTGLHMKFASQITATLDDGSISGNENTLNIENSTGYTVIVSAATDYNLAKLNFDRNIDAKEKALESLKGALETAYNTAKETHIAAHSEMFNRVTLSLGSPLEDTIPTDKRLDQVRKGSNDNHITELFFQYGRYLLMGSSVNRAILPANLQGIWNKEMWAPWESDFHLNINLQMNYWPADQTNLSEAFVPLSNFMVKLSKNGEITAEKFIGSSGWMAHHVSNPFGRTTPSGSTKDSQMTNGYSNPLAGAWMSLSLWRHYEFTQDQKYLKQTAYPVLGGAAQFILDFLKENKKGELVTSPSYSPENAYIDPITGKVSRNTTAASMDIQIINDIFNACLKAEEIIGDKQLTTAIEKASSKLPPIKIGENGTLQEWYEDYEEVEPGHRHMSHLYALYPSNQITKATPELFKAAEKTIERRLAHGGAGQTGWSRAWIINFFARLHKGEEGLKHIHEMMATQLSPNMFDLLGKIFQIEGNLGATAGIAEMLVQSHEDGIIRLLPALPEAWNTGKVKGLKARGNFEISMEWEAGKLTKAEILSISGGKTKVVHQGKEWEIDLEKGASQVLL
ncbi:glycoside hydrolase family 95 protein [uncultured Cyclobacterium sp.]|uniref:glycoside hydrolase family 95 protein n=1 Tax=uncultured Cyclobacterium sp. TaxID=453820 RepID=UPI0030EEFF42|tara:strand:+ start:170232 stop:172625 length:2394 start_codon:yes stop_codon:yes gene_type:complete